jgi:rhamnose utilization protein RhaD (predicted bifunctional aldolase and dehydrogenase)/NAD(P)-dependent dehydrogenase (short-subunit alcohol dehydrogenase family)
MKSQWSDADAAQMVAKYAGQGITEDVALRVYTTRLLGVVPSLVLHGGGNTSVKTTMADITGDIVDVLCVKGSGWDMGVIEPAGLPAVRLQPLLRLKAKEKLADEDMVNAQRINLLDASAPNPSVETLLHAFVPYKFIDHTHANAVLALSDQPNGVEICRRVFGPTMAIIDYVMPGFDLSKVVAQTLDAAPELQGLILHKHGIFTFGHTAREAYERMIEMVTRAEEYIAAQKPKAYKAAAMPEKLASAADVLPVLRGAVALDLGEGRYTRMIADLRNGAEVLEFCNRADLATAAWEGVITPDHTIRIKNKPLVLPAPDAADMAGFGREVKARLDRYIEDYHAYFARNNAALPGERRALDPLPRLILVPGVGAVALGKSKKEAIIAGDLAEATIATVVAAGRLGKFEPLPERDLFAMEYWSLEQAKLGKAKELPLSRQVMLITGGAGAIGVATAKLFAANGAEVVLLDVDAAAAFDAAKAVGSTALGLACDVTDPAAVRAAFEAACAAFGGVDIVISNAGAAWEGAIDTLDEVVLRQSFELNFFAPQTVAQNAVRVMKAQGTGGALLFNASKQAINPGANFGAYGAAKAAALFLSRQYALEGGAFGIRSNAVNADRVRSGLLNDDMIASRAKSRGLNEADYMAGNLLKREVRAIDVAEAFLAQALALKTTGSVTTVDGGNISATLR